MKVILIDDEPTMHLILRKMLVKLPGIQVAGAFTDTKSASSFLKENADIGLVFVDISMPGESGMEFAAKLDASGSPIQVVFVTSHKEFALNAYDLSVLDYVVKPVSRERLQRSVDRALANRRSLHTPSFPAPASADPGKIVLTMLGDVVVSSGAGRVKWISRKCAELFAYLLLYRGKRIPRSRLVSDIFGGMHQANAEKYLNTTVYQLRKSLAPLGLREAVCSENDGYALELKDAVIDYAEFESQAGSLPSIDAGNVEKAQQIERLYTGDLFGDKAYVWAIQETEHYAQLYASFVKRLAAALISLEDTTSASKLLMKLNERNPLDETVMRQLMTIREMAGDKKGLTALYTGYVRLLSRELGIRPSEELIAHYDLLISRIRISDKNK
ncbi:response regulator [Paenibacillus nasutitermitis]|uniref:DNA-binding response regulator n=1 Tax=Paenibacillus nasutitermitis TaxID=1652958 RepID=A0A916ZD28_9BACL|nr:response regulator [Paenibacillus nasutitermitis]GGD89057.1 DNA-binding response regulator [Paenibacillus nasutitermitis]